MDPEACLQEFETALNDNDYDTAFDRMRSYFTWRRNGGFAPNDGDKRWRELTDRLTKIKEAKDAK